MESGTIWRRRADRLSKNHSTFMRKARAGLRPGFFYSRGTPGDPVVPADVISERPIRRLGDADARSRDNFRIGNCLTFANHQRPSLQRYAVHRSIDPQCFTKLAGAIAEIYSAHTGSTPLSHQLQSTERLNCTHQDRAGLPHSARDGVEAPMHAVDEVHV